MTAASPPTDSVHAAIQNLTILNGEIMFSVMTHRVIARNIEKRRKTPNREGSTPSPASFMPFKYKQIKAAHHKRYMREWYRKNKVKQYALVRASKKSLQKRVQLLKLKIGCTDCGYNDCAEALEFDHIRDDKTCNVSALHSFGSWKRILKEIEKCELVCANCHRIRTVNRRKV